MIRLIRSSLVPLTPSIAMDFATMASHKGERPKIPQRLAYLNGKLERGLFHTPNWARAELNGRIYRVNGQHSSTVLAECNGHFPTEMNVVIEDFHCDTDEDIAELFAQFDAKISARSDGDIIMATARQFKELDDVKPTPIRLAVSALIAELVIRGVVCNRVSSDARRAMIGDNIPFILWSRQFTGTARMRLMGVLGAIAETYKKNATAATSFWQQVRDESNPSVTHPTRVLGKFLLLAKAGTEVNRKTGKAWPVRAVFAKCIHAWNADRTDSGTALSYFEESPLPESRK